MADNGADQPGVVNLVANDGRLDLPLQQRRGGLIGVVYSQLSATSG